MIWLVTGISAAGKSTVAQLLAERFDRGVHVKGDVFRRMVVSGRDDHFPVPSEEAIAQLRLRYRLGAATADAYATAGFTTVVQDVILGHHLQTYVDSIRTRPLHVVVLAPSPDVAAQREAARGKVAYRDGYTPHDMHAALVDDTPRIGLWLDTSDQTPAETVDEILRRRDESLL
jgi:chloramphenicol 3-O-phosphotransferase